MNDWIEPGSRKWAVFALVAGIGLYMGIEYIEEPDEGPLGLLLHLVEILPPVLTSVGTVLLVGAVRRQRDDQLKVLNDLELARAQGLRWREQARPLIQGLGAAIEAQFSRWNLTQAEVEVALLLLKGLSLKEVATVRGVTERTVREQSRSIYSKSGLTGRAALSAFFLEDLLAPMPEGTEGE